MTNMWQQHYSKCMQFKTMTKDTDN